MISEFTKISDQIAIDKAGYIFESPRECLEYFVRVVDETANRNRGLLAEVEEVGKEIRKVRELNEVYLRAYEEMKKKEIEKE
jgi:hypothetical protein